VTGAVAASRRDVLRSSLRLSSSRAVNALLGIARTIVLGRTLAPSAYGIVGLASLVGSYGPFAHLGVRSAAFRVIPILRGAGDMERARRVEDVTFTSGTLFGAIAALAILAYALAGDVAGEVAGAIAVGGVVFFLSGVQAFQEQVAYVRKRFALTSAVQLVTGVTHSALVVVLALGLGALGVLVALVVSQSVAIAVYGVGLRADVRWDFDLGETLRLLREGVPIYGVGLILALAKSMDSWLVFTLLEPRQWGLYAFAGLGASFLTLPYAEYIRMTSQYGLEGLHQPGGDHRFVREAIAVVHRAGPPLGLVVGVVAIAVPWVLAGLFPAYTDAAPIAQLLILALLFALPASVLDSALYVLGHNDTRFRLGVLAVVATAVGGMLAVGAGWGPVGVAAGMLCAGAVNLAVAVIVMRRHLSAAGVKLRGLVRAVAAPLLLIGVAGLVAAVSPAGGLQVLTFVAMYALLWWALAALTRGYEARTGGSE
jgi:O-antigen/teichoic acid export membrane protein